MYCLAVPKRFLTWPLPELIGRVSAVRVLLVNLGTTAAPTEEAVRTFLQEFLSDPMVVDYPRWLWRPILDKILRTRPARVAEQYRAIWSDEGSPLETGTRRICDGLAKKLQSEVRFVYRYGNPSLREALEFSGELRIVPLFPQRTGATTGTIEALVLDAGVTNPIRQIAPDAPGYIEALADGFLRAASASAPEHLVVSFHGIPLRYDRREGRRYRRDCETTHRALLSQLGWDDARATLSYQSRFGPEPWVGPNSAAVLRSLPQYGVKNVAVMTPGFVTDGLETLEEIGIRGKKIFEEAGGERFLLVPCVENHPAFVDALADLVSD